jgi:hypothetical protein
VDSVLHLHLVKEYQQVNLEEQMVQVLAQEEDQFVHNHNLKIH